MNDVTFREQVSADIRNDVARIKSAFVDCEVLRMSLYAIDEAYLEKRPFSWACTREQKRSALDGSIARLSGGLR